MQFSDLTSKVMKYFKIVGFNDASFGNLSDDSLQKTFIIYQVNKVGEYFTISWQSQEL